MKKNPADRIRFIVFARSLVFGSDINSDLKIRPNDIYEVFNKLKNPPDISDATFQRWINGENGPQASYVIWVKKWLPECVKWLEPKIDSSPILRLICALDMWGAEIDSPRRKLEKNSSVINVGNGLAVLATHWAPKKIKGSVDYYIPKLNRRAPPQHAFISFQSNNLLSLMEYMFWCGAHIELYGNEFIDWAIDLASLSLMVSATVETTSIDERFEPARYADYSALLHRIFFKGHEEWPNFDSVKRELEYFSEFDGLAGDYSQRLLKARDVLNQNLQYIGCDLSIANLLFSSVEIGNEIWRDDCVTELDLSDKFFVQVDPFRVKAVISRVSDVMYQYEFKNPTLCKRTVICRDLENGVGSLLAGRPELFDGYEGEFDWGCSGAGPTFLVWSILAHHFGHADFGSIEVNRLLFRFISRLPERSSPNKYILTTEAIDQYLNS